MCEFDPALFEYYNEKGRIDCRNAIKMLWSTRRGDLEGDYYIAPVRLWLRVLCTAAIVLRRHPKDRIYGIPAADGLNMGYWDARDLYAGWESMNLEFDPKTICYEIYSDGDWNM